MPDKRDKSISDRFSIEQESYRQSSMPDGEIEVCQAPERLRLCLIGMMKGENSKAENQKFFGIYNAQVSDWFGEPGFSFGLYPRY